MKIAFLWNVTPYGLLDEHQCFGERNTFILTVEEEELGNTLLRNVDTYLPNDTVSYPRIH
jgi:hypothetical protein